MPYLCVYGTLKRGFSNHLRYLGNSEYLGTSYVENFGLADEGSYPFAFRFPNNRILVEVYHVDAATLKRCDALEGADAPEGSKYYTREEVNTVFGEAYMYAQVNRIMTKEDKWFPDGVWLSANSRKCPWLGWPNEIKILANKNRVREDAEKNGTTDTYNPPPRRTGSGEMVKVHNSETGEIEYVSRNDCWYSAQKDQWYRKAFNETVLPEPKVPTKRQEAEEMIKSGLAESPDLPDERVA